MPKPGRRPFCVLGSGALLATIGILLGRRGALHRAVLAADAAAATDTGGFGRIGHEHDRAGEHEHQHHQKFLHGSSSVQSDKSGLGNGEIQQRTTGNGRPSARNRPATQANAQRPSVPQMGTQPQNTTVGKKSQCGKTVAGERPSDRRLHAGRHARDKRAGARHKIRGTTHNPSATCRQASNGEVPLPPCHPATAGTLKQSGHPHTAWAPDSTALAISPAARPDAGPRRPPSC